MSWDNDVCVNSQQQKMHHYQSNVDYLCKYASGSDDYIAASIRVALASNSKNL